MYKKKIIISIIILFLLSNIFAIKSFYNNALGIDLYNKKGYENSIVYFSDAKNIEGIYNKANALYKEKKYKDALKEYLSILQNGKTNINFRLNHNIANSYYKIGEDEKDNEKKKQYWNKAVDYYRDALNIEYNEETKKNLEFVLNKIKEIKEDNSDKKDSEKDGEKGNQSDSNKEDSEQTGTGSQEKNSEQTGTGTSEQSGTGTKENKSEQTGKEGQSKSEENNLTQEQTKALEQYQKALEDAQKQNQNSFNKVYQENNSSDPFGDIFNEPFFNNSLLNEGSNKKDW